MTVRQSVLSFAPLRYVRSNPFSVMALCNILGDFCYLGYALYSDHGASFVKLCGAFCAMAGHVVILAYGDGQFSHFLEEKGFAAAAMLRLRMTAMRAVKFCFGTMKLRKPYFWGFWLLTLNGTALLAEAAGRDDFASLTQVLLGAAITLGCGLFALADLARTQRAADIMTKAAPTVLASATAFQALLAIATFNPFLLFAIAVFACSNLAGFFTRIHKSPETRELL